jgi:hypothetical protein
MPKCHHVTTLAATTSWSDPKILAACEVIAHPRMSFNPCVWALHWGVAAVATTLISYNDVEVTNRTITRRRWWWSTTSSTLTHDYVGSLIQLFFHCIARLVVTIHNFLLASFLGWHGRSSTSIAYSFPYSGIKAVLRSLRFGSCTCTWYVMVRFMWWTDIAIYCSDFYVLVQNILCLTYFCREWCEWCGLNDMQCSMCNICATCVLQVNTTGLRLFHYWITTCISTCDAWSLM